MKFPDDYFEGEEREGFYVEPMMKRAWAAQLEVLSEVDKVCKRHGIIWYADSGTMLGAVRHHGFIPWDDDLDIQMLRADYLRFLKVAEKELPKGYVVLNVYNYDYYTQYLSRISNKYTLDVTGEELIKYHGFPYPAGIDLVPVDYIPRDPDELKLFNRIIEMTAVMANVVDTGEADPEELERTLQKIEELTGISIDRNKPIAQQLRIICDRACGMFLPEDADRMGYAFRQFDHPGYNWPKSVYDDYEMMPFENIRIRVPKGYDEILKKEYGQDYMTPKQKFGHDYPFYKRYQ